MIRLRATKHQRTGPKPGGSSDTTHAALDDLPRTAGACSPGTGRRRRRPARRPAARRPRSAPACDGGVDAEREPGHDRHAGRRQPAAERARHLEPVRRSRGARRRSRPRPASVSAGEPPEHVQHRGRVGQLAQPLAGTRAAQRHTSASPARSAARARAGRVEVRVRALDGRGPEREQLLVGQRQHAGGRLAPPPLHVELPGQRARSAPCAAGTRHTPVAVTGRRSHRGRAPRARPTRGGGRRRG